MLYKNSFCLVVVLLLLQLTGCAISSNPALSPKPEMIFISGGTFTMGDVVEEANSDAIPLHKVELEDFYIGRTEITYAEYDAFARATGKALPKDGNYGRGNRAVAWVNWEEAQSYCEYWGWRLPTENEWEYAARAGGTELAYAGTQEEDSLSQYAVTLRDDLPFTQRVAERKPNAAGLYDMSGNAFEWIGRYYQFYAQPDNWHDLENSQMRIIRGGSFKMHAYAARTYWRVGVLGKNRDYDIGFRCAVSQRELNEQRFMNGLFHRKPILP